MVRLFAQSLDYDLDVPGTHRGGITNADLLDVLAAQGRDFAANTRSLRAHVRTGLQLAVEETGRVPTNAQLEALARDLVLDWILGRMEGRVTDIRLRALTQAYRRRKFHAPDTKFNTIGMRTGQLHDAVALARLTFT